MGSCAVFSSPPVAQIKVMTMPPMRMLDNLSTKRAEYHTQPAKMMKKASCPIQSVLSGLKPSATVVSRPPTKI